MNPNLFFLFFDNGEFIVYAVHVSDIVVLCAQGRPGRQGFPGLTGPDGLKVRPDIHTSAMNDTSS